MADVLAVREEYRMESWKHLIAERARSQMTIRAFCSEHGISTRSYYYWLRKIRQEAAEQAPTFVELSRKNHRTDKPMLCIRYGTATLELPGDINKTLLADDTVVITVGGGGIPVVRKDGRLCGISAVVDKDFASEKLAELIDADMLIILTAVEKVAINYAKPNEQRLDTLTPDEARQYIAENQFAPGSMLPKVEASIAFAESKSGRSAMITKLEKAAEGIAGKTGTRIEA